MCVLLFSFAQGLSNLQLCNVCCTKLRRLQGNLVSIRQMQVSRRGVQRVTNLIGLNDSIEFIDFVAKSASLLYSVASAILLRVKELPKL